MRITAGLLLTSVCLFGAVAPADATVRKGSGTDSVDAPAAQDVIAYAAQADDAGRVGVAVKLSAPPTTNAVVLVLVGTRSGAECGAPYVLFSARPTTNTAIYNRETATDASGIKNVTSRSFDGDTLSLVAEDPAQLAVPFNCVEAAVSPDGGTTNLIDDSAVVDLAPDAPPAPPATTTTAPPPPPPPPPPPTTASTPPVAVPQAAKLSLSLSGVPRTVKRNRTIALKLRIANDGSKPTARITLARPAARGLSVVGMARSIAALKPGAKKTVTVKVKLTRKARSSTPVRLSVRASKLRAMSSVQLKLGTARKAAPAAKDAPKNPLVGTYWWRTEVHVDRAWDNRALYFVDGSTVYSGFPKGGLPKSCTTPPAKPEEEFDVRDGCLPYTYDAKTGAVTIGEKAGSFKDGKLAFDDDEFEPLALAAPGARFDVKDLQQTSFFGTCGVYSFCTVSYEYLTLTPTGEFVTARSSTTTSDTPSSYTQAGSYPPDQRGTYEVRAGGIIHLAYANGTVKDETFAVQTKDGKPEPVTEGLMVGDVNYYPDP